MITEIGRKGLCLTITLIASGLIAGCQQNSNAQAVFSQQVSETEISADQFSQEQLDEAKKLADLGLAASKKGNFKATLKYTEQAIGVFPGYSRAYFNRGVVRKEFGDNQGALADYTRAIELYPDTISPPRILHFAYSNRGILRFKLGDNSGAIADSSEAIKLNPNEPGYYGNRGMAYHELKNYESAIADYSRAIELKPNVPGWNYNKGNANFMIGNYQEAVNDLDRAISLNPFFGKAYSQRGHAHKNLDNLQEAEADYTKALELKYREKNAYFWRARVRSELGKYSLALADYDQVIGRGSDNPSDYHSRSVANHHAGNLAAAQKDALKAAELYLEQGDNTQYQSMMMYAQQYFPY